MPPSPCFPGRKDGASRRKPPKELEEGSPEGARHFPWGKLRHGEGEGLAQRPPPPPLQLSSAWTRGPAGGGAQAQQVPSTAGRGGGVSVSPPALAPFSRWENGGPELSRRSLQGQRGLPRALLFPALAVSPTSNLLDSGLPPEAHSYRPRPASRPQPGSATRPVPRGPLGSTAGNCPVFCQPQGNSRLGSGMSC